MDDFDDIEKLASGFEIEGSQVDAEPEPSKPEVNEDEQETVPEAPEAPVAEAADEEEAEPAKEPEQEQEPQWKRVSKLTHKLRRAEEKLRELEAAQSSAKAEPEKLPEIPAFPDLDLKYSDPVEFQRRIAEREQAIEQRALVKARNDLAAQKAQESQQAQFQAQQAETQAIVSKYVERALEAGIPEDKLAYNEEVLKDAGVSTDLAKYLYSDPQGAKLVNFLADNPAELDRLQKMNPFQAVEHITLALKPKIGAVKSRATKAPDPVKPTKGHGAAQVDEFDRIMPGGYSIG